MTNTLRKNYLRTQITFSSIFCLKSSYPPSPLSFTLTSVGVSSIIWQQDNHLSHQPCSGINRNPLHHHFFAPSFPHSAETGLEETLNYVKLCTFFADNKREFLYCFLSKTVFITFQLIFYEIFQCSFVKWIFFYRFPNHFGVLISKCQRVRWYKTLRLTWNLSIIKMIIMFW